MLVVTALASSFSTRSSVTEQSGSLDVLIDGQRVRIEIVDSPNVDDVVVGEMQAQAHSIFSGASLEGRRVDRSVRDYLVRLGVLR
jgi:hypothetical protein